MPEIFLSILFFSFTNSIQVTRSTTGMFWVEVVSQGAASAAEFHPIVGAVRATGV